MNADPSLVYNVRDFGAAGDGVTLDTKALNLAVAECNRRGGGTVWIPAGTYLTGPPRMGCV